MLIRCTKCGKQFNSEKPTVKRTCGCKSKKYNKLAWRKSRKNYDFQRFIYNLRRNFHNPILQFKRLFDDEYIGSRNSYKVTEKVSHSRYQDNRESRWLRPQGNI